MFLLLQVRVLHTCKCTLNIIVQGKSVYTSEDTCLCVDSFTCPTVATFKVLAANKFEAQMRYHNELFKHKRYNTFHCKICHSYSNKDCYFFMYHAERQLLPLKQVV